MNIEDAKGQWINITLKDKSFPFNLVGGDLINYDNDEISILKYRQSEKEIVDEQQRELELEQEGLLSRSIENIGGIDAEIVIDRSNCPQCCGKNKMVENDRIRIPDSIRKIRKNSIKQIMSVKGIQIEF